MTSSFGRRSSSRPGRGRTRRGIATLSRYFARLKPGATLEQAQAQIDVLNAANLDRFPAFRELLINAGFHTVVNRLQDQMVKDVRATLYLMWGGALFVLLIGCVNVANLALVRSRVRMKELATRLALGAGTWRVARQLAVEHLVLSCAAAVVGYRHRCSRTGVDGRAQPAGASAFAGHSAGCDRGDVYARGRCRDRSGARTHPGCGNAVCQCAGSVERGRTDGDDGPWRPIAPACARRDPGWVRVPVVDWRRTPVRKFQKGARGQSGIHDEGRADWRGLVAECAIRRCRGVRPLYERGRAPRARIAWSKSRRRDRQSAAGKQCKRFRHPCGGI